MDMNLIRKGNNHISLYLSTFGLTHDLSRHRLQVNVAKIQQTLPELKRDGDTVLSSVWANLLYAENSTSQASGVLPQTKFIPMLMQDLQDNPDKVIADFNELRRYCKFTSLQ